MILVCKAWERICALNLADDTEAGVAVTSSPSVTLRRRPVVYTDHTGDGMSSVLILLIYFQGWQSALRHLGASEGRGRWIPKPALYTRVEPVQLHVHSNRGGALRPVPGRESHRHPDPRPGAHRHAS